MSKLRLLSFKLIELDRAERTRRYLLVAYTRKNRFCPATKSEALSMSIRKWKFVVASLRKGKNIVDDGATTTCPLCWRYHGDECWGCPVYERTGRIYCAETPYPLFDKYRNESIHKKLAAAEDELAFLLSLRPKKKEKKRGH